MLTAKYKPLMIKIGVKDLKILYLTPKSFPINTSCGIFPVTR